MLNSEPKNHITKNKDENIALADTAIITITTVINIVHLLHKEVHTPETTDNPEGNPYRKAAPHDHVLTTMWQAGKDI